ncbi:sulfite exporter TauE/SafE family protein [Endozoicomonas sp. SM1973]|uniref:Probable membrane transporter protein n=1 Tax=Spartinivicinus marinus TaxID=2994442 RepID=A0A853IBK2_9GAMM|nr:sulfite exporter TauE/SafE family protein [Spartinivicinus marinus]MCX4027272.1 sulfite exporter TauE/SafE family protein [Spartinivicinus marinus]NYZ67968.1 sulfite exporter TauE/SafE family protein [Spartinivicinus marinus]
MDWIILMIAALVTSTISGVLGFAGGQLFLGILPIYLPSSVVIPMYGANQLVSNSSRFLFAFRCVHWEVVGAFLSGSIIGVLTASLVVINFNFNYFPLLIGLFILLSTWTQLFSWLNRLNYSMWLIGCLQSGLGVIVGATGPLATAVLTDRGLTKDGVVATNAVLMAISHVFKVVVYGALGYSILGYWPLIIMLAIASVIGTYIGTKVRHKLSNKSFSSIVKWVLTLVAVNLIVQSLYMNF